ncbi:hypothetical protein JQ615_15040 [Bradyrhizobium jicamae]|uniref:Secreted protein n=1 Tax=Bradyrhizobium jicamae TaxID=280332 RepID=A0ABS5FIT9_9BRAD|nr:DUF6719 family protein [Bradyrhizobium jicamae]MBR0796709.1 hypothetical protein [Bradyrhizobium jicamae]MBR0935443.1 hypothetical protein [Bradyrhizobium jicamae]
MPRNRNVLHLVHRALFGALALMVATLPAAAQQAQAVSHERDIVDLRVGQRVLVDDGTCPAGKIKQVTGSQLNQTGVVRTITCVPRLSRK